MNALGHKVLILILAVTLTAAGQAAAMEYKNYGVVGVGASIPTGGLDDAGYDAGIATWVSYGRMLTDNLAIEAGGGFFYTDQDLEGNTSMAGYYTREDHVGVSYVSVTLKAVIPAGPVMLFAGGGIGGYYVSLDSDVETSAIGDFNVDDDDSAWGVHLVAGASWDISSRFFVGGQGLYRWTDDIDIYKQVGSVPVRFSGDLDGYSLTIFGGFRF